MLNRSRTILDRRTTHWFVILIAFLPATVFVLPITPFGNTMEDLTVLTAQEVARSGHWAMPTLWGQPRIEKPPLAHWICAAGIELGGPIEFSARWTSLLVACMGLIVTYEWGRFLDGWRTGLVAAAAAGSSLLFLRFARQASYDGQLLFWVALANLGLSWLLFDRGVRRGLVAASIGLAGAMLTKGPPALLHTVAPFAVCCVGAGLLYRRGTTSRIPSLARAMLLALVATIMGFAALLPWATMVVREAGGLARVADLWQGEMTRSAERIEGRYTSPLNAMIFMVLMLPWAIWLVGSAVALPGERTLRRRKLVCLLVFALLPVVIHAFVPPMPDRYLVPMLPAAAIAAAMVYMSYVRRPTRAGHLAFALHIIVVAAIAVVYPLMVALVPGSAEGSMALSAAVIVAGFAMVVAFAGPLAQRWWAGSLVVVTFVLMMCFQITYASARAGHTLQVRHVAQEIARLWPADSYLCDAGSGLAREIAIQLSRPLVQFTNRTVVERPRLLLGRPGRSAGGEVVGEFTIGSEKLVLWRLAPNSSAGPEPSTRQGKP